MALPEGYRFRAPRDEDAGAVAAIANEVAEALIGTRLSSPESELEHWTLPSVDRENDVAVVETPAGEICGCFNIFADPPYVEVAAFGLVALEHHGRGIGGAIVEEYERRARRFVELAEPGRRVLMHSGALAGEPRVSALLASHGYREVRRFLLMRRDFSGEPEPPSAIEGIAVRTLSPDDTEQFYEAHLEAWVDHWGEGDETLEDFKHWLQGPRFDPELWFLAWDREVVAGYAGARLDSEEDASRGYVLLLGVRRAYRRRGIGEALLRHAFRALYARGKRGCDLHVDAESLTDATKLYERVGMSAHLRFATWEKELRPGNGA